MSRRVTFDDFVVDLDARDLLRNGQSVVLSPKAFDLLEMLVESRPTALSKTELQERLWPDTFVVDKNLTNLVVEVRHALGDTPARARFIRTVHRFGYAFREPPADQIAAAGPVGRPARFRLEWLGGHAILHDGEYLLGRDPGADVFLDSSSVSRRHARLSIASGRITVADLDSKNGTFVGNVAVHSPTPVEGHQTIRLGSMELTIKELPAPLTTRTEIIATPVEHRRTNSGQPEFRGPGCPD